MGDSDRIRRIDFTVILDLDLIEEIQKREDPDSMCDDYFYAGLSDALRRIEREASRGMNDFSTDSSDGFGGGYWKIKSEGIQIRWEIVYPRYIDWSNSDD